MDQPNRHKADAARYLVDTTQFPGVNQNMNAGVRGQTHQYGRAARPGNQRVIKIEENIPNNRNGATLHPPLQPHPAAPTPMPYPTLALAPTNNVAQDLQSHLIRQQIMAGIAPENIIRMNQHPQGNANVQGTPALIQITNHSVSVPHVPPATFIPRSPYPVHNEHVKREGTPAGQFLTVPDDRQFQRPTFELPPPAFRANVVRSEFDMHNAPPFRPGLSLDAFLPNLGGYAEGVRMPRRYFEPPANQNEPREDQAQKDMLGHPMNIFDETLNDDTAGYNYVSDTSVKNGVDEGQEQHMLGYPVHTLDEGFNDPIFNFHAFPDFKFELDPDAVELYPMGRASGPSEPLGYGTLNTDGTTAQPTEDKDELQIIQWSPPEWLKAGTLKPPSTEKGARGVNASSDRHAFSILLALLHHPEITVQVTGNLHVQDLINLQATSRASRSFIVTHLPRVVRLQSVRRFKAASRIFPWRCYQKLWFQRVMINDEIQPYYGDHPNDGTVSYTASLRWLQMVRSRDQSVKSIMTALKNAGYPFPPRYKAAIFKLWFLMDIPDMERRMWTIQNRNLWTDLDLFMAIFFIIRIDMYVKLERGNTTGGQRRLIMTQPGLKFCQDVLTGHALRDEMEYLSALIRWRYNPLPEEMLLNELFGVPPSEAGSLQYEGYGEGRDRNAKLRRPDEIILLEAERRLLNFRDMYRLVFLYAQAEVFTACERPDSVWDHEMRLAFEDEDTAVHNALRLD